jgi:hypothetical protein
LDGLFVLANLVSNYTKKMERVGIIRLGQQDLVIDILGNSQIATLMVLDCLRQ